MDIRHVKNTPYSLSFPAINAVTPAVFLPGLSGFAVASYIAEVGGGWSSDAIAGSVFEIGSGLYGLELTAAELDHDFREIVITHASAASTSYKFCTLPMPTLQNLTVGTLVAVATPASRIGDPFFWSAFQSHDAPVSVAVYTRETDGTLTAVDLSGRTLRAVVFEDIRPTPSTKFTVETGGITTSGSPVENVASMILPAADLAVATEAKGPWRVILQDVDTTQALANGWLSIHPGKAS